MNEDPDDKKQEVARVQFERAFPRFKLPEFSVPADISESPKVVEPKEQEPIVYTRNEIKNKSDSELESILITDYGPNKYLPSSIKLLIEIELNNRSSKKDRRLSYAVLIVSIFAMASGFIFQPKFQSWISEVYQFFLPDYQIDTSHQSTQELETSQKQQEKQPISSDSLSHDQQHLDSHSDHESTKSKPTGNKHKKPSKDRSPSINQSNKN